MISESSVILSSLAKGLVFLIAHRVSYGMKYSVESEKKYISLEGHALWDKPVKVLYSYKLLKDYLPLES